MAELKPCPFCGKKPKYKVDEFSIEPYRISCNHCFFTLYGATEKEVVERWNKRS